MLTRLKRWWRRVKRATAVYQTPADVTPALPPEAVGPGQSRFIVRRQVASLGTFDLYDGPFGAVARKYFEHVRNHAEPGSMQFIHDGVVRSTYSHPTEP